MMVYQFPFPILTSPSPSVPGRLPGHSGRRPAGGGLRLASNRVCADGAEARGGGDRGQEAQQRHVGRQGGAGVVHSAVL